jgi:hypothetical protein
MVFHLHPLLKIALFYKKKFIFRKSEYSYILRKRKREKRKREKREKREKEKKERREKEEKKRKKRKKREKRKERDRIFYHKYILL